MRSFAVRHGLPLLILLGIAGGAAAQDAPPPTTHERIADTGKTAGRIATQPARDVGAQKIVIPPAVSQAAAAPYSLAGLRSCARIGRAIAALNDALGPDYAGGATTHENRAGKIAEAGGKTVVNAFIPFRGLIREVSGAAPAERRLNADIRAAFARRGFLRGVATARKCRLG